jgi:hypothetical protein
MVDRTAVATGTEAAVAEIAVLRQKLAATAARVRETGKPNTTEAYKDNALTFTSWTSDKIKSAPTLDDAWLHFCATRIIRRVCEPQPRIPAGAPSRIRPVNCEIVDKAGFGNGILPLLFPKEPSRLHVPHPPAEPGPPIPASPRRFQRRHSSRG